MPNRLRRMRVSNVDAYPILPKRQYACRTTDWKCKTHAGLEHSRGWAHGGERADGLKIRRAVRLATTPEGVYIKITRSFGPAERGSKHAPRKASPSPARSLPTPARRQPREMVRHRENRRRRFASS